MSELVPDLHETNKVQEDLLDLCRDLPHPTDGPFPQNSFYGIANIIRRYARLSSSFPIAAVIPHSVMLDPSFVWGTEIDARVPAVLSFPEYRDEVYRAVTSKRVIPSASPYIYLVRMLESIPETKREGTIFFPAHSTHHVTTSMRPEKTAANLSDVDGRFRPVTVCMYWRDIQLGRHTPYLDRGLRVVSAGHIFDDRFLYRLHWLCSQHTYSSGDTLGSHTFFSVESGCTHISLFDEEPNSISRRTRETFGERVATGVGTDIIAEAIGVFMSRDPDLGEQRRWVDYFLGRRRALPPGELGDLLRRLRSQDRWGFRSDGGSRWIPPGWIMRSLPARGVRYLKKRFTGQPR
jgi:hypothetical protein